MAFRPGLGPLTDLVFLDLAWLPVASATLGSLLALGILESQFPQVRWAGRANGGTCREPGLGRPWLCSNQDGGGGSSSSGVIARLPCPALLSRVRGVFRGRVVGAEGPAWPSTFRPECASQEALE